MKSDTGYIVRKHRTLERLNKKSARYNIFYYNHKIWYYLVLLVSK